MIETQAGDVNAYLLSDAIDVADGQGMPPLMRASIGGHAEAARLLIENGSANLDRLDQADMPSLYRALVEGLRYILGHPLLPGLYALDWGMTVCARTSHGGRRSRQQLGLPDLTKQLVDR